MAIGNNVLGPRGGTIGIWTDDCSMSLCMATSLIYNKNEFVPKHIRYLFGGIMALIMAVDNIRSGLVATSVFL